VGVGTAAAAAVGFDPSTTPGNVNVSVGIAAATAVGQPPQTAQTATVGIANATAVGLAMLGSTGQFCDVLPASAQAVAWDMPVTLPLTTVGRRYPLHYQFLFPPVKEWKGGLPVDITFFKDENLNIPE
jgi:hypothetical protein